MSPMGVDPHERHTVVSPGKPRGDGVVSVNSGGQAPEAYKVADLEIAVAGLVPDLPLTRSLSRLIEGRPSVVSVYI